MIHYTCDRCKRKIDPTTEIRYVVEIDVRIAGGVEPLHEEDDEVDQLSELNEQLERELTGDIELLEASSKPAAAQVRDEVDEGTVQYDLCERCYEAFAANPLGKELSLDFNFSNN
ncbi:MAG: hypothetical protein AAF802_33230 [Planctomycetota bacterium]